MNSYQPTACPHSPSSLFQPYWSPWSSYPYAFAPALPRPGKHPSPNSSPDLMPWKFPISPSRVSSHFISPEKSSVCIPTCLAYFQFSSVQLCPILCNHMQHARLPCPSTPRACWNSCPSSHWCHPPISSSVVPFFYCLQSFPASGSIQMSQFFALGGQNIGVSALASVLPMNIQDWFPLGLTGWISLQSKGLLKSLLQHHSSKASIPWYSAFFIVQLSHAYMTTGKTIALII